MNQVLGALLPLALGVAISPIPVIAVILMLLSANARSSSLGLLAGWLVGILVATGLFVVVASTTSIGDSSSDSSSGSTTQLVLGVVLVLLAARRWRSRPEPGTPPKLPRWMSAIDRLTAGRAAGLGFGLAAVNPKNLLLCAAAGIEVAQGGLSGSDDVVAVLAFTIVAGSTVLLPVLGYTVASKRLRGPLDSLRVWLEANNGAVMATLLLVFGFVLIGKGIGGF